MDLSAFFDPIDADLQAQRQQLTPGHWGTAIATYQQAFPAWEACDLLLMGCREARGGGQSSPSEAAQALRRELYRLAIPDRRLRLADLGDLKPRQSPEATYEALAYVLSQLIGAGKTVLFFGGSPDLAMGQYMAYEAGERPIGYTHVGARLALEDSQLALNHHSYNHRILTDQPSYLFQFSHLGYQRYLVPESQLWALREQHCLAQRYGELAGQIEEAEPALRQADMVGFDLAAIRQAEAPGAAGTMPGGLGVMEACRLARYAGLAYRVSSFQLGGFYPELDRRSQTAKLAAMLLWYFAEGRANRWDDQPRTDRSNLQRYVVRLHASIEHIDFYKHPGTGRWWMEVPYPAGWTGEQADQGWLVPCSEKDYEFARGDDIPERWWLAYGRLGH